MKLLTKKWFFPEAKFKYLDGTLIKFIKNIYLLGEIIKTLDKKLMYQNQKT